MRKLVIGVDVVASIRESRKEKNPDPVAAASLAEIAGADGVSIHLRQDKRHIRDRDLYILRETVKTKLNLHIAPAAEMLQRALEVKPSEVTLLPEHAGELATEQGLDLKAEFEALTSAVGQAKAAGSGVYALVDPNPEVVKHAVKCGLDGIEIFAHNYTAAAGQDAVTELDSIVKTFEAADKAELDVRIAGGLDYTNIVPLLERTKISEFVVGYHLMSRAILVGIEKAVREMVDIVKFF